jgi:hypothetical protein
MRSRQRPTVIDARRYDIAIDKLLGIKELMAP